MRITSKVKDYSVEVLDNALQKRDRLLGLLGGRPFFVVDEGFCRHYRDKLRAFMREDFCLMVEATEENKSYLKLADYYRALLEAGFTRNDVLVTFGGGVLQDICGFIASTLYRGVKWAFFPTTLLAQADSCIGSKTSINFDHSKNLIGTFYPPDMIYIDIAFCTTLPAGEFNSGMGEIIKFHLLSDRSGFERLKKFLSSSEPLAKSAMLKEIILSTLEIKRSYFEGDEFDTGRRNLLNYGHCYGHALESASGFALPHGEAVIVGMGFANVLSLKRGLMSQKRYEEIEAILKKHYPRYDLSAVKIEDIIHYLKRDKKRTGKDLTMILARDIGDHVKVNDVQEVEVVSAHADFLKIYSAVPCS